MILDTSAILAIFLKEPGHEAIVDRLAAEEEVGVGAPTLAETGIALEARFGPVAAGWLSRFLAEFRVVSIPFGDDHWHEAVAAYARFGRGRHPAGLDFGDCLAYAVARLSGEPLLCVADDFAKTDVPRASIHPR